MNGCQQGFRSVASSGFGVQKSAQETATSRIRTVSYNLTNKTMKITIKLTILTSLILLISCKNENENLNEIKSLSQQEMLQDFETFEAIYQKANAGLYTYRSKHQIDSVFAENKANIADSLSYREFYNLLWNVIDFTGSCHNQLEFSNSLFDRLSQEIIFFPIPLKFIEE